MKRPKRRVHHFGDLGDNTERRSELVRRGEPAPQDLPGHLARTQRSKHLQEVAGDQYVAVLADKLIGWVAQQTADDLHAIQTQHGMAMARFARAVEEQARQEFGEHDPYFRMLQEFTRVTLNDYFNHLIALSDETLEVLRRVIADDPYFHQLPERKRGFLRWLVDQVSL